MSDCTTLPLAYPLNLCTEPAYTPYRLYIGDIDPLNTGGIWVIFTNLATGRVQSEIGTQVGAEVSCLVPDDFAPGTVYSLQIMSGGQGPIEFEAYLHNPVTDTYSTTAPAVAGVLFMAVKRWDGTDPEQTTDQWVILQP